MTRCTDDDGVCRAAGGGVDVGDGVALGVAATGIAEVAGAASVVVGAASPTAAVLSWAPDSPMPRTIAPASPIAAAPVRGAARGYGRFSSSTSLGGGDPATPPGHGAGDPGDEDHAAAEGHQRSRARTGRLVGLAPTRVRPQTRVVRGDDLDRDSDERDDFRGRGRCRVPDRDRDEVLPDWKGGTGHVERRDSAVRRRQEVPTCTL